MATTHYNFTELVGTNDIDIVDDVNTPLGEIDTAIYARETEHDALETAVSAFKNKTIDNSAIQSSTNPISSGAVYTLNEAIKSYLKLSDTGTLTLTIDTERTTDVTATIGSQAMSYALNADKTFGKIYGLFNLTRTNSDNAYIYITTNLQVEPTGSAYTISRPGCYLEADDSSSAFDNCHSHSLTVDASGNVGFTVRMASGKKFGLLQLTPDLYFFEDFGDA